MVAECKRLRLPSSRRLKTGHEFTIIKNSGCRMVRGCLIANWIVGKPDEGSKLGVITGKKIGPAVVRNRARRLLREAFRLHQFELSKPLQLVLVARASIVNKAFREVERDFLTVLREARLLENG